MRRFSNTERSRNTRAPCGTKAMPAAIFCGGAVAAQVLVVEADRALALRPEPEYGAQHRRLAGAVRADHRRDAALGKRHVDAEQHLLLAVERIELLDIQHRRLMT